MSSISEYYVYMYIDPRNMRPFYYGKGKGNRKLVHKFDRSRDSEKSMIIDDIYLSGDEPIIRVVASRLTQEQALLVEASLIWREGHILSNAIAGQFSDKFRPHNTLNRNVSGFDYSHEIHLLNVGEGPHRNWEANRRIGFLGCGQGNKFRDQILQVNEGDIVVAYLSKAGYVGIGKVYQKAKTIREFLLLHKNLTKEDFLADSAFENSENPELSEYCLPIKWIRDLGAKEAVPRSQIDFHHLGFKASLSGKPMTLKKLEQAFKINFEEILQEEVGVLKAG